MNSGGYQIISRRHRKILRRKKRILVKHINPGGLLLDACQSLGALTYQDAEIIKSAEGNWKRQIKMMLKCLKRRPDSAFDSFRMALEETEQYHVAKVLLGHDECLMSQFHQDILRHERSTLVKNINPEGDLLDAMISTGAISRDDAEQIRVYRGKWKRQVDLLLECVTRRPDEAFRAFIKALLLCDQSHIANTLLKGGLKLSVRMNLKRKRSVGESDSGSSSCESSFEINDLGNTINRLIDEGLFEIQQLCRAREQGRKLAVDDPGGLKQEYLEKLLGLLENFNRTVLKASRGSIIIELLCWKRESVWDLRSLCRSEIFLEVCRRALIPEEFEKDIDVEVTVDEGSSEKCIQHLDNIFPPPSPSPIGNLPLEMFHLILKKVLSAREVGIRVRTSDLSMVANRWNCVLQDERFKRDHRRFIESTMRPYLYSPVQLQPSITSDSSKAIIGVCILGRRLYVARSETPFIEVFAIPEISSDVTTHLIPAHQHLPSLSVPQIEMPFNMAASTQSNCLYVTDFSRDVGCVWKVLPEMEKDKVKKFTDNVGRPIGINVSRDNYIVVVSESPNCVRVFSRFGEKMTEIQLSAELEAPRQAICTEPERIALIHGYLEPLNRVVELDRSGRVLRCYGSTLGCEYSQIHWPAALICDEAGRMLVADRENRRIHLIQRNFRLKRHLLTLDKNSVARPRRLCIDDKNGILYVGFTDPTVKVYRVAHPRLEITDCDNEQPLVKGINCYGAPKQDKTTAKGDPSQTGEEEAMIKTPGFVLPPGECRRMEKLNDLPVEFLQKIFLKAAVLEANRQLKLQDPPQFFGAVGNAHRFQINLSNVCKMWNKIVGVMHFQYRLNRFVKGWLDGVKRRYVADQLTEETADHP